MITVAELEAAYLEWIADHGRSCSCHIDAPCSVCTDPVNPYNLIVADPEPETTSQVVTLDHIPGALAALEAVQYVGGVLLTPESAVQLTVAALHAADPHVRADVLADIADDLYENAADALALARTDAAYALGGFAYALDQASHEIRKAVTR